MTPIDARRIIRVLVVDDQDLVRGGIVMLLGRAPGIRVIGEAPNGRVAIERARALRPDVILMDILMPELSGIEATAAITQEHPNTGIVLLTTYDTDENAFRGLRAGASAFLLKDIPGPQLIEAVRTVAAGDALVAPRATRRLLDVCRSVLPSGDVDQSRAKRLLSPREHDVYLEVIEGLSNQEIATRLYLSEATVKSHVRQILAKLELRDRVHVILYAHDSGDAAPHTKRHLPRDE